jgi:arylsulfatase A
MIVRWPGKIAPNALSDLPWYFADVLPTLAEIAGTESPDAIDGVSVLPTILGNPQSLDDRPLYWEFFESGFQQAVRLGNWKAVRLAPGEPMELYNLSTDEGEINDVASRHPEVVARIEAYMKTARTPSENWPVEGID